MALPAAYLAEVQTRKPRLVMWVEIEGLPWGLSSPAVFPSNFSTRWASGAGSTTGSKGVQPTLLRLPTPVELSIDPLETICNIGQTTIETHDYQSMLLEAASVHRSDNELYLSAALTASATSIVYLGVADTAKYPTGGGTLFVDAETIVYTGHDTGTKTFSGCTRGFYGSTAVSHLNGQAITPYPRFLVTRKLTWYASRHPDITATSDDVVRFRGVVSDYKRGGDATSFMLTAEHDLRRLDWEMFSWQVSGTINGLYRIDAGGRIILDLSTGKGSTTGLRSANDDSSGVAGKKWVQGVGYTESGQDVFLLKDEDGVYFLCELKQDGYPRYLATLSGLGTEEPRSHRPIEYYDPLIVDYITYGKRCKEVWDVGAFHKAMHGGMLWPAPNFPVDNVANDFVASRCYEHYGSHHPMNIALAHLLSDGVANHADSAAGTSFKWFGLDPNRSDRGLNDGWAGFSADAIDQDSFTTLRDTVLSGAYVATIIEEPISMREFLVNELLRPFGCVLSITDDGKLTVRSVSLSVVSDASALPSFSETNILADPKPEWSGNVRSARSGLIIRNTHMDMVVFNRPWPATSFEYGRRVESMEVETSSLAFGPNSEECERLNEMYRARFQLPAPYLTLSTDYSLHDVVVGQAVRVTCQHIPDTAKGTLGLTNKLAHVVSKRPDDAAGKIDWVLEVTGTYGGSATTRGRERLCKISPTLKITAINGMVLTVEPNEYSLAPAHDLDHFIGGNRCRIVSLDYGSTRVSNTSYTVQLGASTITVGSVTNVIVGDIIQFSKYISLVGNHQRDYAYMADTSGDLDPAGVTTDDRMLYRYVG